MIGFAIGVAIWFLVIMPAIVRFVIAANNPLQEEYIREKMKRDLEYARRQAEIRRLEIQNIALRIYAEMQDREQRMSYSDTQRHFDCSQCCQFSCGLIRDAGTAEVLRDEIKALPEE